MSEGGPGDVLIIARGLRSSRGPDLLQQFSRYRIAELGPSLNLVQARDDIVLGVRRKRIRPTHEQGENKQLKEATIGGNSRSSV